MSLNGHGKSSAPIIAGGRIGTSDIREFKVQPDYAIDGSMLQGYVGPCVYGWRRGESYLYFGMSKKGVARPLSHLPDKELFLATDTLEVWRFNLAEEARVFETQMIRQWMPLYNKTCVAIKIHPPKYKKKQRRRFKCAWCSGKKDTAKDHQEYCSPKCRRAAWFDRTYTRREK